MRLYRLLTDGRRALAALLSALVVVLTTIAAVHEAEAHGSDGHNKTECQLCVVGFKLAAAVPPPTVTLISLRAVTDAIFSVGEDPTYRTAFPRKLSRGPPAF